MQRQILVTGAGGFIGSHLIEHLVARGFKVRAMIRYSSRTTLGNLDFLSKDVIKEVEIIKGDLKDPEFCYSAVKNCNFIFHLGALIGIPYSYVNPNDYVQTNIVGTVNMLNAARREGNLERFIHTSTSEVYGTALYTPIDEKHAMQPQSPYSASKISADKMVESYYNTFDTPITIIRPFNTFGPRQSARAVIPTIISQLFSTENIQLGSLDPKRDFLFVKDTAEGFYTVGTHTNTIGQTVNIGTGKEITIGETYKMICNIMGKSPVLNTDYNRIRPEKSEVLHLLADVSKAQLLTGWRPKYEFKDALKQTIEWMGDNLNLFKPEVYTT